MKNSFFAEFLWYIWGQQYLNGFEAEYWKFCFEIICSIGIQRVLAPLLGEFRASLNWTNCIMALWGRRVLLAIWLGQPLVVPGRRAQKKERDLKIQQPAHGQRSVSCQCAEINGRSEKFKKLFETRSNKIANFGKINKLYDYRCQWSTGRPPPVVQCYHQYCRQCYHGAPRNLQSASNKRPSA